MLNGNSNENNTNTEIDSRYESETKTLRLVLENNSGFRTFLDKVVQAGPQGYLSRGYDQIDSRDDLLERGPEDTILILKGSRVSMWRMSHVYYLLREDKTGNEDTAHKEVIVKLKKLGWVRRRCLI